MAQHDFSETRAEIRAHYDRLLKLEAELYKEAQQVEDFVPEITLLKESVWEPVIRSVARCWLELTEGDWRFGELVRWDLDTWRKIREHVWVIETVISSMGAFGGNIATLVQLETAAGGQSIREQIVAWDRGVSGWIDGLPRTEAQRAHVYARPGGVDGRDPPPFPDFGPRLSADRGGTNLYSKGPLMGSYGDHYRASLDGQKDASRTALEFCDNMMFFLQSAAASYNDFLASLKALIIQAMGFVAWLLVWAVGVVALVAALKIKKVEATLAAACGNPIQAALAAAAVVAAQEQLLRTVRGILYPSVDRGSSVLSALITLRKNALTLDTHGQRFLRQLQDIMAFAHEFPGRRWPNPLRHVEFPAMVETADGTFHLRAGPSRSAPTEE